MGLVFRLAVGLLMVWSFSATSPLAAMAGEPLIVAEVGDIPVTVFELQREFQRMIPMQVHFHSGISREKLALIKQQALDRLIEQARKVGYALDEKIQVDNAAVDARMAAIRARFNSPEAFAKALGDEEPEEFRASLYRQLLAAKAETVAVDSRVKISDIQARAWYDDRRAAYMRPHQFKASQILIKVDPASNQEERKALRQRAEALLTRARAGEDFYNLAYYHSEDRSRYVGGDLGYFHEGQTVKEFEEALKRLKPGAISDLIETMYGYHIVKLFESNAPRQLTFAEVREKIRKQLEKEARDRRYDEWLTTLRERYPARKIAP